MFVLQQILPVFEERILIIFDFASAYDVIILCFVYKYIYIYNIIIYVMPRSQFIIIFALAQ